MESDKRDAILAAASELFSRLGTVSMDDIARRAGVSKATLYLVGENKNDLFYQCVHRELQQWIACVGSWLDPRKNVAETLPAMCLAGIEFARSHRLVRDLFAGAYAEALPEWKSQFEQLRALSHMPIAELLRLGVRKRELQRDLEVETLAALIQDSTYAGFVVYGDSWGSPEQAKRWVDAQMQLCLRGLRKRAA